MSEHRLPRHARPSRYTLHLTADPGRPEFDGHVTVDLDVQEATDRVVLHAHGLKIHEATLGAEGSEPASVEVHDGLKRITVRPATPLGPGKAVLRIAYTGTVRQDMAGLYLSKDGDAMCLATQCEATDARTIVPCFDEPAYKATWAWSVTAPKGLQVLTNGAHLETVAAGGLATHRFAPTPPMSSYLIACVMGRFAATEEIEARGVPFRVWAMEGHEGHGAHGNALAARMLAWYEDYFGQPYAFGKYDQVAVPSFAFGAMENAGLVLFRPSLVLLDEQTASWDDRRHVALVVAHEFAHMWFGDLVTMAWWDDLWLNEAFAEWIAHKCADAMDPSLEVWVPFRQRAAGALATDALASTHAIYHPVKTPEEAQEMFDAITYGKGSAVMRMLESYLGEEAFCAGLRAYMEAFRFRNAQGSDLWTHLGTASGEDVAGIMQDWVAQAGHPTVACRWDGALHVQQQRTRSSPEAHVPPTLWRVPLVIRYGDDAGTHEHRHLMTAEQESVELPVQGALRWVWPNAGDGGFYRSALDDALLDQALRHRDELAGSERVGLLRDLWVQVRQGTLAPRRFLEALRSTLDGDAPYEVVEHQAAVLRLVEHLLHGDDTLPMYREWVRASLGGAWQRIGTRPTAGEDAPTRQRRATLLRILGGIGADDAAVQAARALAAEERDDPAKVEAGLAGAAVAVEAIHGDRATFGTHLATYRKRRDGTASPQEVERYLYVLGAFREPALVDEVLSVLAGDGVSAQAEGPLLRSMLVQPHSQRQAWAYVQRHWDRVEERLGEAWLAILVEACGELPTGETENVVRFLDERLEGRAAQAYGRAKERLRERRELEDRVLPALRSWVQGLAPVQASGQA